MSPQPNKSTFASTSGAIVSVKHTAGVLPTACRYGLCAMCACLSDMLTVMSSSAVVYVVA